MLKGIGILCILFGSTGLGFVMAGEMEMRVGELQELRQQMMLLRGEIRYMHQPLPEAFSHLARGAPQPFRDFFQETAEDIHQRNGQTAEQIWKKNRKLHLSGLHLSRQEQKEFEELGNMLGYLDVEMQLNALDYYLERLRQSAAKASEAWNSRRRLYQYLGILSGLMLVVFII